jgi:folate-binding protein YgfZ
MIVSKNSEQGFDAATRDVAVREGFSMGLIRVNGADRRDLLHRMSTNNLLNAKSGTCVATVFTNEKGRIVDFVHVLVGTDSLMLLTSKGNEDAFIRWIDKFTIMEDIKLSVITEEHGMLSLVGLRARQVAEDLISAELKQNTFAEKDGITVLYRNEFGTDFIEIIAEKEKTGELRQRLAVLDIAQIDEDCFEAFRISRGIPRHGSELTSAFNPYEVGLRHAISFNKGCYIGQEVIARLDTYEKVQRSLWAVVLPVNAVCPQTGASIMLDREEIGTLTSISQTSIRDKRVGLAVLKKNTVSADKYISIVFGGNTTEGVVASVPVPL